MGRYIDNPFTTGTVYREGNQYGYFGKDIYGKFHESPVFYNSYAKAKEALEIRLLRRRPYIKNPFAKVSEKYGPVLAHQVARQALKKYGYNSKIFFSFIQKFVKANRSRRK